MASKTNNAAYDIASSDLVTDGVYRSVDPEFRELPGNEAPSVQLFGYGEPVYLDDNKCVQRIVARALPQTITITAQLPNTTTSGVTLTASTTDIAALQEGQLILLGDEIVRVTTIVEGSSATTATITRAFAGTTIDTQATSSVGKIMAPAYLDTATFPLSPWIRGEYKSFYPQQIMYGHQDTAMSTAVRSYMTKGETDLAFDDARVMAAALKQLEVNVWYGKGIAPTISQMGAFDGIARLITSNEVPAGGVLTGKLMGDLAEEILAWDNNNNVFTVAGNRNMKRIWDTVLRAEFDRRAEPDYVGPVKVRVDRFETSLGTFEFLTIPNLKDGELYFVKRDDIKLHPLAIRGNYSPGWGEVNRDPAHTDALVSKKSHFWLGTLIMGDERLHGKLTGITTTPGSYTGYF